MKGNAKKRSRSIVSYIPIYLMMLPGLLYLFINNYMPLPGLVMAFKSYNARLGIYKSPWAGLKNFKYLFGNDAWYITRNTILYNLAFLVVNTVLAIAIAIILSEMTSKVKKLYQSSILLPYMISTVIVSYLVYAFLGTDHGLINTILVKLGRDPVAWYNEAMRWPGILIFVNAWKGVGYSCIVYLATIMGFDPAYYEAAVMDGATKWQQIRLITLPLLRGTVIMLLVLSIGHIFYSDFGLFYQVPRNSGALFRTTNTIDTYVYRGLLELGDVNMSAAAGFYQSIVGFILVIGTNLLLRVKDPENALF